MGAEQRLGQGPEGPRIPRLKEIGLTPQTLVADNHSQKARDDLTEIYRRLVVGEADMVLGCSDSRLLLPFGVSVARSISASTRPELGLAMFSRGLQLPRSNIVVVHDPCGGLGVKEKQKGEALLTQREFSADYVGWHVYDADPYVQGLASGRDMVKISRRPTLVTLQHHETGTLDVLGILEPNGQRKISREGILRSDVPDIFQPFLHSYDVAVAKARNADPDFEGHQQVINPSAVLMTTQQFGHERFPDTLGRDPNSTFTVTIPISPFDRLSEQGTVVPLDQVHYAIDKSLKSKGDTTKSFGNLARGGTIVIEAGEIITLAFTLNELLAREHMLEWLKPEFGNQIIIARSENGYITQAEGHKDFQQRLYPGVRI